MQESAQKALESRVALLTEHMSTIRRQMEKLIAENRRMREVVRLAEGELRKRRDQVQNLESELQSLQDGRLEAKARVEHAMEQVDELISEQGDAT
jgi:predicted nuclease with TOPRIM domain